MIDASIPLQVQAPRIEDQGNALMRVLQMRNMQQEGEMNTMRAEAARREFDRTNKLYDLLQSSPDAATLRRGGYLKEANDMEKNAADVAEKNSTTTKNRVEAATKKIGAARDMMFNVSDPQTAAQLISTMHADPDLKDTIGAVPLPQLLAQIPQDPAQFGEFKNKFSMGAEKFMADLRAREGHAVTMRGQDMTDARTREEGAANRSVTMRGQNLTDARSREANANGRVPAGYRQKADGSLEFIPGGPADPAAAKKAAPTEFQGKAGMFGTRAQEADRVITELEGKYSPAGINAKQSVGRTPLIGGGLEAAGNMALSDSSQKAEQAQRDFVNAVLRLESGAAIGKDEFENARRQYFTQPGDRPEVIAQKARNRKTAIQGLMNNARPGAAEPSNTGGATGSYGAPSLSPDVDALVKKYGGG